MLQAHLVKEATLSTLAPLCTLLTLLVLRRMFLSLMTIHAYWLFRILTIITWAELEFTKYSCSKEKINWSGLYGQLMVGNRKEISLKKQTRMSMMPQASANRLMSSSIKQMLKRSSRKSSLKRHAINGLTENTSRRSQVNTSYKARIKSKSCSKKHSK